MRMMHIDYNLIIYDIIYIYIYLHIWFNGIFHTFLLINYNKDKYTSSISLQQWYYKLHCSDTDKHYIICIHINKIAYSFDILVK